MSEEDNNKDLAPQITDNEPSKHTYSTSTPDTALYDYVVWANKGLGQGITITVKGTMYTGQLISGADWCDLQIELQNHANSTSETKEAITSYYSAIKSNYYSLEAMAEKDKKGEPFHYLHMKNARVWDGKNLSDVAMHWRFKIGEVDGFAIGSLSKN